MEAGLTHDSSKRCVVKICKGSSTEKWKKITDNVLIKAEANGTLASYYRDHKDEYICMGCYNAIVVNAASSFKEHALNWDIGLKRRRNSFSISESISLLTNFIFEREVLDGEPPVFSFSQLRSIAINKNNDLSFFFDQIEDMACLGKKTEAEKRELERSLAYQCYLMCWNQSRVIPLWNLYESETGGDYFSWVDGVNVLSKFLYDHEKVEQKPAIYSFKQLRKEMVAKDIRLSSFFNSIYNAALPSKKSDKYLDKLDKRLAVECYIICSNQNSKLTAFKEDISLFLDLMGLSAEALDALSHAGITISRRHLDRKKTEIANNHSSLIESYLENNKYSTLALNVDDYHNIHAKRMPNTCSTSTVAHMMILLLNHINITAILQMTLNNASIYNPKLIDFELICNTLGHFYMERMAKTFNDRFYYETSLDEKLENLSLHNYDARITERREERKMKDTILLDFFELKLEDMASYISALQRVYENPSLNSYLTNSVIPVIADWPGQVFIRQAITLYLQNHRGINIPNNVLSFIPVIGVLHTQLNLLESILKIYWRFFNMEYKYIFSTVKDLSQTPSPYRTFLLLELVRSAWKNIKSIITGKFGKCCRDIEYLYLFDLLDNTVPAGLDIYSILFHSGDWESYVEDVLRAWCIFLRFERRNYNKAPLVFLSDVFYWSRINHPILNVLRDHLVKFTDYPVENMHSIIRRQTSSLDTPEQLSKTAKVINAKKANNAFENAFVTQHKSTYANKDHLILLTKKAEVFLLRVFEDVYQKLGQSSIKHTKNNRYTFQLASLNFAVDQRQMPLGFSSNYFPSSNACDYCYEQFDGTGKGSIVIVCGHGYHESCFINSLNKKCNYCEKFLNLGVDKNVSSLLTRLSKLDSNSNLVESLEADETNNLEGQILDENDILEKLEKNKDALPLVEQAYVIARERFLSL